MARIAEDEAAAERGGRHNDTGTYANDNYGCLLVDPARVLAECEAKRRIVEVHRPLDNDPEPFCWNCDEEVWPCRTMASLAAVYADHPDYREEWKS